MDADDYEDWKDWELENNQLQLINVDEHSQISKKFLQPTALLFNVSINYFLAAKSAMIVDPAECHIFVLELYGAIHLNHHS